ncbi:MAG: glycosyltransferase, partial [Muribaculaceae bacterium]|nr:glycosyltransferase [Muribaculaceae bacterium]
VARIGAGLPKGAKAVAFIFVPAWVKEPSASLMMKLGLEGKDDNTPDYLTHRLNNEESDEVCVRIRELQNQGALDKIKVIYAPCYLDGNDGIFNIAYYDILPALDLTIFPSYYEPWGYTPLESVAFGVPTVTTDLSGFGQWVASDCKPGFATSGVEVIHRSDSNYHDVVTGIASAVRALATAPAAETARIAEAAEDTAAKAMWCNFIDKYTVAYEAALKARDKRIKRH